tara:strand:+ start:15 stop:587 length:573 start_codon:yes stop_codon:yes gene_type:complete
MHRAIDVIDNFYTQEQLDIIFNYTSKIEFNATLQPHSSRKDFATRYQAYPCYESKKILKESDVYKNLYNNLIDTDYKVTHLNSFFRKIYKSEIEKSVCAHGAGIRHKDGLDFDIAGLIYLDELSSFKSGTRFFTDERFEEQRQQEQDIQIGSKFNRAIIFNAQTSHQAMYDLDIDSRFVQPFFIQINERN